MKHGTLILASSSPRRMDLLNQAGIIPAGVSPADIDETPLRDEKPKDTAVRLAMAKAAVIKRSDNEFVLAADTVVACGRNMLSKAEDVQQAEQYINMLSGRRHRVYGGICIITPSGKSVSRSVMTTVKFKKLSDIEIKSYLDSGEWEGKAGGYAIQGMAAAFIKTVHGSYTNVVGLCLYNTWQMLSGNGFFVQD